MTTAALDPVFPLYRVVFVYDRGDGTPEETTTLMKPWLFKEDPGAAEVERQARERWPGITWRDSEEDTRERRLVRVVIERKDDVPWVLAWFAHETFRAGRTDAELHDSFERYVQRFEGLQNYESLRGGAPCLMGAEDRWRWQPFCTCETCAATDIALIAH